MGKYCLHLPTLTPAEDCFRISLFC